MSIQWDLSKPNPERNEKESCINRTLNKVSVPEIFVNLTYIIETPVYSEHKRWSEGDSV
jgi:hypothetical protein